MEQQIRSIYHSPSLCVFKIKMSQMCCASLNDYNDDNLFDEDFN